jgi:hypothetical protein
MIRPGLVLAAAGLASCGGAPPVAPAARPLAPAPAEVVFAGMCDASGAVPLTASTFMVADDESNVLRVYHADRGGPPLASVDLSPALGLPRKGTSQEAPEIDLEAATRLGDHAYWLTSHGRNRKGKRRPERLLFFATTAPASGDAALLGPAYDGLLADLIADPRLAGADLTAAAARAPKEPGGLNLEGLTARPDGGALIGFRSPLMAGKAVLVPLDNPAALADGRERARLGDPILLDLGGQGVRALSRWRDRYLVIAGDHDGGGPSHLYTWSTGAPVRVAVDLAAVNPEGFFSTDERDRVLLLSDDGTRPVDGAPCKDAPPERRRFRGVWVDPA